MVDSHCYQRVVSQASFFTGFVSSRPIISVEQKTPGFFGFLPVNKQIAMENVPIFPKKSHQNRWQMFQPRYFRVPVQDSGDFWNTWTFVCLLNYTPVNLRNSHGKSTILTVFTSNDGDVPWLCQFNGMYLPWQKQLVEFNIEFKPPRMSVLVMFSRILPWDSPLLWGICCIFFQPP